jgi:hypothetical protein
MAYVGFDLDETLGSFGELSPYLEYLASPWALYEGKWSGRYGARGVPPGISLSDPLLQRFRMAMKIFVLCMAENEKSGEFRFIRPSILYMAKRLWILKKAGVVNGVVIYSNNRSLANVLFAASLIERVAETPGLFCNSIHLFHPVRGEEIVFEGDRLVRADKRAITLYNAFSESNQCRRPRVPFDEFTKSLYFFDDLLHPDVKSAIGERYFQVPVYSYSPQAYGLVDLCFRKAFTDSGLEGNDEYYAYNSPIFTRYLRGGMVLPMKKTANDIIGELKNVRRSYRSSSRNSPLPDDSNLLEQFDLAFPPYIPSLQRTNARGIPISKNVFTKALGTLRKLETRRNKGENLNAKNKRSLQNASTIVTFYENQNPNQAGGRRRRTYRKGRKV